MASRQCNRCRYFAFIASSDFFSASTRSSVGAYSFGRSGTTNSFPSAFAFSSSRTRSWYSSV